MRRRLGSSLLWIGVSFAVGCDSPLGRLVESQAELLASRSAEQGAAAPPSGPAAPVAPVAPTAPVVPADEVASAPPAAPAPPALAAAAPIEPRAATASSAPSPATNAPPAPVAPAAPPTAPAAPVWKARLSAGVALPQSLPDGTTFGFSVDYRFVGEAPGSKPYAWVIEPAVGEPAVLVGPLEAEGTLQAFVPQFRLEQAPFHCYLAEPTTDRRLAPITPKVPLARPGF